MALTLGSNAGFITGSIPTTDPAESNDVIDNNSIVIKHITPAGATAITQMGWYCDNATPELNYEVALYAADGATVPGEAGTRLYVGSVNAKGTTAGWKNVTGLNWTVTPNTSYWLGLQCDNGNTTFYNYVASGGSGMDVKTAQTALTNPYAGGALSNAGYYAGLYAKVSVNSTTFGSISISGSWKNIESMSTSISGSWKTITSITPSISGSWKAV